MIFDKKLNLIKNKQENSPLLSKKINSTTKGVIVLQKKVGFNFFRPVIINEKGEEKLFDFKDVFEQIRTEYQKAKVKIKAGLEPLDYKIVYKYYDEPARLSEVNIDIDNEYYHLVFERLGYELPKKTTLHGESEVIDLDDDEYIGIDVNVLYDPVHHIFMIQRNRNSLGPTGIEMFLKTIIKSYVGKINGEFSLPIVSDPTAKKRAFNQYAYRKLHIKVTGLKANGLVEKFWPTGDKNVESVEITFNSSTNRNSKIDDDFVKGLLEEYVDDADVQKLQIRAREKEDSLVEPIDLIDHKLQTFINFNFKKDRQLNPVSVFEKMVERFNGTDGNKTNYRSLITSMWSKK